MYYVIYHEDEKRMAVSGPYLFRADAATYLKTVSPSRHPFIAIALPKECT